MFKNPRLADLAPIVGEWQMELSNAAFLPGPQQTVNGQVVFAWIEEGGLIAMRQEDKATWVIGRDDESDEYTVLYYDSRGVSRVYHMTLVNRQWRLWRNHPEFSQRYEGLISDDDDTITSHWEKSTDGGKTWNHDFDMKLSRSESSPGSSRR
ncbi:MAG: hypothetical protein ACHQ4F_02575 [Candidatus Dormibacteria bacterium]